MHALVDEIGCSLSYINTGIWILTYLFSAQQDVETQFETNYETIYIHLYINTSTRLWNHALN